MANIPYEILDDGFSISTDIACADNPFYEFDLKHRKLTLNDIIDQDSVADIVRNILQFNAYDKDIPVEKRKPILLYITSDGGDVQAGYQLIDAILYSKTPVYTINTGWQYSMAFLVGLAGKRRYSMPNATFLMHEGDITASNSSSKLKDMISFNNELEKRTKDYVLAHSNLTEEEYDSKTKVEWYLFADEAKKYGFTDYVIGEDCDIDAIV